MSDNQEGKIPTSAPPGVTLLHVVGRGAFSTVHAATLNGKMVAIKRQKSGPTYLDRELALLQSIPSHPHLLGHISSFHVDDEIWFVSELLTGGDVSRFYRSTKGAKLSWTECIQIALDAANALAYLHEKGIIHRDIKSANLLLDENRRCKVCDFGLARQTNIDDKYTKRRMSLCGTDAYMAPEMFCSEEYDERADIFSLGVVFMELICRREANASGFLERKPQTRFNIDIESFRKHCPSSCPRSFVLLAESCVSYEADDRPTAIEVHEWLEALRDEYKEDLTEKQEAEEPEEINESNVSDLHLFPTKLSISGTVLIKTRRKFLLQFWKSKFAVLNETCIALYDSKAAFDSGKKPFQTINLDTLEMQRVSKRRVACTNRGNCEDGLKNATEIRYATSAECTRWLDAVRIITNLQESDEIRTWLKQYKLEGYAQSFRTKGFPSLDFLKETGLADEDFHLLGIDDTNHQNILLEAVENLRAEDNN